MDAPIHLRPMSIGEILDRSFRLYRNHFLKFFLAVLLVQCVVFVVTQIYMIHYLVPLSQMVNVSGGRTPDLDHSFVAELGISSILILIFFTCLTLLTLGAVVHLVNDTFLGKSITITDAYRETFRRFWPLLRLNLVKFNLIGVAVLIWLVPLVPALVWRYWLVAIGWVIVGALPGFFAYLWLALASIVLILEGRKPLESIKRSGRLMFVLTEKGFLRNNGFRISIILLVIFAVKIIVLLVVEGPYGVWKMLQAFHDPSLLGQYRHGTVDSVFDLILMAMQAAATPFGIAAIVLFYYDIRIRKEGLDLSVRLQWLKEKLKAAQVVRA